MCEKNFTFLKSFKRMNSCCSSKMKICFNIRGRKYETFESTLLRYPHTMLGDTIKREKHLNYVTGEYVFNCSPDAFDAILFFYQSNGILSRSSFTSEQEFNDLLYFFELKRHGKGDNTLDTLYNKTFRNKLWIFLEYPRKTKFSLLWAYMSFFVIFISVATICFETVHIDSSTTVINKLNDWFKLECAYISFFTIEYAARLYSAPSRPKFFISLLGLIDLFSIIPFFVHVMGVLFKENVAPHRSIAIVRILRVLQVLRIIKLSRYSSGMQILGMSIKSCSKQILSLGTLFLIGVLFSSSCVFVFENTNEEDSGFDSIPSTMWYIVVTMTTVGYGDVVAKTPLGKVSSAISMLIGTVILFHLFLPIYLMHFAIHYEEWNAKASRKESDEQNNNEKKSEDVETVFTSCDSNSIESADETASITSLNKTFECSSKRKNSSGAYLFQHNNGALL